MPKKRYADQERKYISKNVVFNLCINGAYIICCTIFPLLAHYSRIISKVVKVTASTFVPWIKFSFNHKALALWSWLEWSRPPSINNSQSFSTYYSFEFRCWIWEEPDTTINFLLGPPAAAAYQNCWANIISNQSTGGRGSGKLMNTTRITS